MSSSSISGTGLGSVTYVATDKDYVKKRQLKRTAGAFGLWAIGVSAVISGDFSGWNGGIAPVGIHAITHTDNREAGDHHVIVQYFRNRPWIGHLCGHRQGLRQEAPTQAHRGGLRPVGHRCLRRHLRRFLRMERRHRPSRVGRLPHRRHRGLRHVRAHAQLDQRYRQSRGRR